MRGALKINVSVVNRALKAPFDISGHRFESASCVVVEAEQNGMSARGEGSPIFYRNETAQTLAEETRTAAAQIACARDHTDLANLVASHGGRNALDAALICLRARLENRTVSSLLGLSKLRPVLSLGTIALGDPAQMAAAASVLANEFPVLKIKLGAEGDEERIRAVSTAIPKRTRLVIDANAAWSFAQLEAIMPALKAARVEMIEQPLPAGADHALADYRSPSALCADESFQTLADLAHCARRYQLINVKLDKCGGLTAALEIAQEARLRGMRLMVGNMLGSSLGMAPAFVFGQMCELCDLDGPLFLKHDESPSLSYQAGLINPP